MASRGGKRERSAQLNDNRNRQAPQRPGRGRVHPDGPEPREPSPKRERVNWAPPPNEQDRQQAALVDQVARANSAARSHTNSAPVPLNAVVMHPPGPIEDPRAQRDQRHGASADGGSNAPADRMAAAARVDTEHSRDELVELRTAKHLLETALETLRVYPQEAAGMLRWSLDAEARVRGERVMLQQQLATHKDQLHAAATQLAAAQRETAKARQRSAQMAEQQRRARARRAGRLNNRAVQTAPPPTTRNKATQTAPMAAPLSPARSPAISDCDDDLLPHENSPEPSTSRNETPPPRPPTPLGHSAGETPPRRRVVTTDLRTWLTRGQRK